MKERRIAREIAMQILFQWELQGHIARNNKDSTELPSTSSIEEVLAQYLESFYAKDRSKIDAPFSGFLIANTLKNLAAIDKKINAASKNWKLERMDAIDRAILRIACFELFIQKKLAKPVIINEALEIAKRYGSNNSRVFINGILDSISQKEMH